MIKIIIPMTSNYFKENLEALYVLLTGCILDDEEYILMWLEDEVVDDNNFNIEFQEFKLNFNEVKNYCQKIKNKIPEYFDIEDIVVFESYIVVDIIDIREL